MTASSGYVEEIHIYDFELMNVNTLMPGSVTQSETVVTGLTGQITSPGVLSP